VSVSPHSIVSRDAYWTCRYVSEVLYIHSKVMIVDDRSVIVRMMHKSS
jgi:phosphatidylserine/phosphatidylglycerophosphate/cardiolipin synthase-like enzyme